jgi:hypothetical protein
MYSPVIAEQLRRHEHDAVAVKERPDLIKKDDDFVFAAAQMEGRVLMTENFRDFQRLHLSVLEAGASHCGLIYTTEWSFFRGSGGSVGDFVRALEALIATGVDVNGQEIWLRRA